jgi:membrane-bound lytic murein transglycosylase D
VNHLKGNTIRAGKHLIIPVASTSLDRYTLSQQQRLAKTQNKTHQGVKTSYLVQSGDNLWDISRAHKVSHRSLAKWNGIAPGDPIKPGQKLVIWQQEKKSDSPRAKPAENAIMRNIIYKVRNGDSLARIADKFNVTIGEIEGWNNISRRKYLQPGQHLTLKVDVTNI